MILRTKPLQLYMRKHKITSITFYKYENRSN